MAMATLTTAASPKQAFSFENSNISTNLCDVSFSSYTGNKDILAGQELNFLTMKKTEDGEIGVFSAEKYFNGVIDEDNTPRLANVVPTKCNQPKKDDEHSDEAPQKPEIVAQTPSIQSESTWNSQTALPQRNAILQRKTRSKENGRCGAMSFLVGRLGCSCYCSDKDSTDVIDDHVGELSFKRSSNASGMPQSKAIAEEFFRTNLETEPVPSDMHCQNSDKLGMKKETCFSFRAPNLIGGNLEQHPRKSLEVFGSPIHDKRSKSFRIGRRLSMLSWDVNPRRAETEYSASGSGAIYNDNDSDGSSELFEIESVTGKVTPFLIRQESDATSGCITPTTAYAPSEASIEWSVVTASLADFSVLSDYEELRPSTVARSPIKIFPSGSNSKTSITPKGTPRRHPSTLLGCNSNKAIKVAGDAYRTSDNKSNFEARTRRVSDSYLPTARFPIETKLTSSGFKTEHHQLTP